MYSSPWLGLGLVTKVVLKTHSEAGGEVVEPAIEGPEDPLVVPHVDEAGDAVEHGHAQVSHGQVNLQGGGVQGPRKVKLSSSQIPIVCETV